jgi:hypothetical protein
MSLLRVLSAVLANIGRNRRSFVLSSIGLIIGVATLTFFVHLGMGIQDGVLNRIYPVNQIEVEPKSVGIVGLREDVIGKDRLGKSLIEDFRAIPDVVQVFPKLRSKFQARLWGGQALFGYAARTEAFFDGLDPDLLHPELKRFERVDERQETRRLRRQEPCLSDDECRLGQVCRPDTKTCGDIEYWQRFTDDGIALVCDITDPNTPDAAPLLDRCPDGLTCENNVCQRLCGVATASTDKPSSSPNDPACPSGQACVAADCPPGSLCQFVCRATCAADAECRLGEVCNADTKSCERLRCTLPAADRQLQDDPIAARGRLTTRCANGVTPDNPACEPLTCPGRTYCAPRSLLHADGFCEAPIPVVLSPVLIELFNNAAASSLGMQKIDGLGAMLGVQFQLHFGDSYFAADLPQFQQSTKRAEITGFSQKAAEFGVTMPRTFVEALNARYKGATAAETYDTFILETAGNEDVSSLIAQLDGFGMTLARRSEDAQKAGDLLFILTVVFSFISIVILFVAGVNIMHTFLTLVTERRHEIGIMRAIGATRGDIRRLFLTEALVLGLFGGVVGNLLSYGATRLANWIGQQYLANIPFKPDEFFAYDVRVVLGGIAFACVFCLLGAFIPARRAARLDPAVVLSS